MSSTAHMVLALCSLVAVIVSLVLQLDLHRRLKAQAEALRGEKELSHALWFDRANAEADRDALRSRLDTTLAALGNAIAEREALRREIVQPRGKDGKFRARERADG